jgi:hypothetical protein
MAQVVEHPPRKGIALSLHPSTTKKKKKLDHFFLQETHLTGKDTQTTGQK